MPLGFTTCLLGDSVCVAIAPCSPLEPGDKGRRCREIPTTYGSIDPAERLGGRWFGWKLLKRCHVHSVPSSGHTFVDLSGWDVWCWRTGAPFFLRIIQCVWQFWAPWCEFSKSKGWNQIPATKINGLFQLDPLPTIIKQTSENSTFCCHESGKNDGLLHHFLEKMRVYLWNLPPSPIPSPFSSETRRPKQPSSETFPCRGTGWDGRPPSATVSRIHRGIPQFNGRKEPPPFETNR